MGNWLRLLPLACVLGGCVAHSWAPGPGMSAADFPRAKAQCELFARGQGGGFYAQGSPNFVAGAALGAAIGQSIRQQNDFNDCMLANGWRIADPTPVVQSSSPYVPAAAVPPPPAAGRPVINAFNGPAASAASGAAGGAGGPVTITTPDGAVQALLPAGWETMEPKGVVLQKEAKLFAQNRSAQIYLGVVSVAKADYRSLEVAAELSLKDQLAKLGDAQPTSLTPLTVNGRSALRYEVSGFASNGVKVGFLVTVIEQDTRYVKVGFWTVASKFTDYRNEFASLTEGVTERTAKADRGRETSGSTAPPLTSRPAPSSSRTFYCYEAPANRYYKSPYPCVVHDVNVGKEEYEAHSHS